MVFSIIMMALAQTAAAPTAAVPERKVCREIKTTGSRLAAKRICLPKSEWQRMYDDTQEKVRDALDQSLYRSESGVGAGPGAAAGNGPR